MTCEARQTPKGHTTVYCGKDLLATISGSGRTREERMRLAKIIAASVNMCRYIPHDADLDSLNDHAKYMMNCSIYGGGVLSQIVKNIKQFKQEAGLC
jgi:hypothetical protein